MAYKHKERQLTRLLQVSVPRDAYILLGKLIQTRVEKDYAPSKVTKSAVLAEAIIRLAVYEGLIEEPTPETEKLPAAVPFYPAAMPEG